MDIYFKNTDTTPGLVVDVNDNSCRDRAIKSIHTLTLYYSLPEHIEVPVGAWTVFEGGRYELLQAGNFKKINSRNFDYTLIMEDDTAKLKKYKYKDTTSRRLKFSHTAKPQAHLKMLVDNLNARDSGWSVGECISANEKTLSFNHSYCLDALGQLADAYDTEWEIVDKQIHLRKVEYNKDNPLALSYGKGNGFKSGVGRTNYDSSRPVEILYVQGGDKNINPTKYGSSELLLPKNKELEYEGRRYVSDADGYSIRRKGIDLITKEEDSLDCAHIFPQRVGTISSVITKDAVKHFYDFTDASIPADLDYNEWLIEGETMTVVFQEDMLTGKEFEVKYKHSERKFEIVPQELDGRTMPDTTFKPVQGRKYAVFGISLPNDYVCNNTDKTGASWDMFREAAKYFYEHEDPRFTFTGELNGLWAKKDWLNIGGRIKLGGYVLFSDTQFQQEGVLIRIVGVRDFINNPQSPTIELSNCIAGESVYSELSKITENEVITDNLGREALQFTKRRFRDSQETITALGEAMEENFSNFSTSINPIAVQTMAMLVGDESLQFVFVQGISSTVEVAHNVTYNQAGKQLTVPGGYLQHKTIGINSISSGHTANEYKTWYMQAYTSAVLTDTEQKYYVYAKVNKTAQTGAFIISPTPIAIEGVNGYYHLLVGILNSEFEGERSYVSLHGYTEILPGQVLTQKVISSNGKNFMDFLNNAFRIGDDNCYLDWNASLSNLLGIKNANIQIVNAAGKTMIYFSGANGSGQFAGGNITWDAAGNIKAKGGTFTDIVIQGSLRNPFVRESDSIVIGWGKQSTHDNVVPIAEGGGWITSGSLEWGVEQSGRRMCIANYRWGSAITEGQISYSAPSGKYFYEDGIAKNSIHLSRECVELMGYGTETQFYGWIVLNRINLGTNARYGRKVNALAQGIVSGYSSGASVNCKTFDNSSLSVTRLGEGQYKVYFPSNWGLTVGNYIVPMTGYGGGLMKASLLEQGTSYFIVDVSDDASRNDGSFMFQIINLNDWI